MKNSPPAIDRLSCFFMLMVGALWGMHGPLLKLSFASGLYFPQVAAGEYFIGALAFGLIAATTSRSAAKERIPGNDWILLVAGGVVGSGVALFLFWSYQLGPVPVGAALLFLYVPFTQIINFLITRKAPPRIELISVVLVVIGATLATNFLGAASSESLRGVPQAILAALCFAGFFILSSRLGHRATPAFRSFFFSGVSFVIVLFVALLAGWKLFTPQTANLSSVGWLLALGAVGQIAPVFLLVKAAPKTGSGLGSILTSFELPVAVGLSAWILGDKVSLSQIFGIGFILLGIALPHLGRKTVGASATE